LDVVVQPVLVLHAHHLAQRLLELVVDGADGLQGLRAPCPRLRFLGARRGLPRTPVSAFMSYFAVSMLDGGILLARSSRPHFTANLYFVRPLRVSVVACAPGNMGEENSWENS